MVSFQRFPSTHIWHYAELPWLKRKSSRARLSLWSQPTSMVLAFTGDGQTPDLCATQESRGRFKPRTWDVPCPEHLVRLKEATLGCLESYPFSRGHSLCSCPQPPTQYHLSPKANPVLKHPACRKAQALEKCGSGVTCFVPCGCLLIT